MTVKRITTEDWKAEDWAGLLLAVLAHVALVVWLVWVPRPPALPMPAPITVTLQGEVGAQASAPSREAAAAAVGPVLSENPVPEPGPVAKTAPQTAARVPLPPASKTAPAAAKPPVQSAPRGGGASRIGDDFLKGVPGSDGRGKAQTPAGPVISAQVRTSLQAEVSRQLKPHWQSPDGVEVDQLATTVEWNLNLDGTLASQPRCIAHRGETAANRPQVDRHCEQAKRAVRLTRFALPAQFYAGWQRIQFEFNRKLNQ